MPVGQIAFHSPKIYIKPTNGTPLGVLTVQEFSFDAKVSLKPLMGENKYAEAIGAGSAKAGGKFKNGRVQSRLLNEAIMGAGNTTLAQSSKLASAEAGVVAAQTYTVANALNFIGDWGVSFVSTGLQLTRVASLPTAGQYSVNEVTGVYTFNAADNAKAILVSYQYKVTGGIGRTVQVTNQLAGEATSATMLVVNKFQGGETHLTIYAAVFGGFSMGFKLEDFAMPDVDFECQADSLGRVFDLSQDIYA
jgi:hypothetical protein